MTDSRYNPEEVCRLLWAMRDGRLEPNDAERLSAMLAEDRRVREQYVEYMFLAGSLQWDGSDRGNVEIEDNLGESAAVASIFIAGEAYGASPHTTIKNGNSAPRFPAIELSPLSPLASPPSANFIGGPVFSYMVASVVLCLMLLGAWAHKITHNGNRVAKDGESVPAAVDPRCEMVAQITGMKDCRWAKEFQADYITPNVSLGREFNLADGLLELTYKSGAKVILEGPCSYKVDSRDGGFLRVGKLVARVEKRGERRGERGERADGLAASATSAKPQAANPEPRIPNPQSPLSTLHSPLFTIATPTAVVTDLGTEFGVEVEADGSTSSQVFQGIVEVMPAGGGKNDAVLLGKNDFARVRKATGGEKSLVVRGKPSGNPPQFVRKIPRQRRNYLDLADIVAGGDGFGQARNRGINPVDGGLLDERDEFNRSLIGDGRYHSVKLAMIDGVFIPDGGQGPVQIDSAEHSYSGFPDTIGKSWHFLWSGQLPATESGRVSCWLKDVNYAGPRHSVLSMTPNKGITFDLEAVRRKHKGARISRFTATAGNTEMRSIIHFATRVSADLWVFVDGELRFSRTDINSNDGAFDIDIALAGNARFLTLAATDAGNTVEFDWTIFGDPKLHIEPAMENKQSGKNKPHNDNTRGKGDSPM